MCYKSIFDLTLAKKIFAAKRFESSRNKNINFWLTFSLSADLSFSHELTSKGFIIFVSGYNDKILHLLDIGLKLVQDAFDEIDESVFVFEAQKAHMKNMKNSIQNIDSVSREMFTKITTNDSWMTTEIYEEFDRVTLEDVQKFIPKILKQLKIQVLIQGNLTKAQAEETVEKIEKHFACQPIDYVS